MPGKREKDRNGASQWVVRQILHWFAGNARDLPWRRMSDPYAVWVSEIMLQQTQVKTVIPYFERWMRELPDIEALAGAAPEKLHKLWEGLGYYTRVRNMQRAALKVMREHAGVFPRDHESVLSLPGIGRYTAGAVCSIAYNHPQPIVDGNIVRVLTRFFGLRGNAREKSVSEQLWNIAQTLVAHAAVDGKTRLPCSALNQGMMELGAMICVPRAPLCGQCPLSPRCMARKRNWIEELPNLGKRTAATQRRFVAALISRNGRVLVRQRPEGVVNGHLWEFPNVEVALDASDDTVKTAVERELGCELTFLAPFATVKHSITRYRVTLEAMTAELKGRLPDESAGRWKSPRELKELSFTSAHRRAGGQWKETSGALNFR